MQRIVVSLACLCWLPGLAQASDPFRKDPYLQNVSTTSITIMWEASRSYRTGEVRLLGAIPPRAISVEPDDDGIYEAVLSGLAPGRRYRYAVECGDQIREGEFATAPTAGTPFTFIAFGDTRSNARLHRRVVDRIRREVPDFLVSTGDLVDDGGRDRQWQEFFDIERRLLGENVMFPSVGNHDRQGRGRTAHNYRKYFALPENSPDPERYYAFTYSNARFLVLDSNAYSFSLTDQTGWLEEQLRAARLDASIQHIFVIMHHPPFSISLHGGQNELRERWTPIFEQYGVTAVFSGHDHVYSRAERAGIRYFVTGGGGAPLYPRGRRPSQLDVEATKYFERVRHYLRVHVIGELVEVSAIRVDGTIIETVSWGSLDALTRAAKQRAAARVGAGASPEPAPAPTASASSALTRPGRDAGSRFGMLGTLGALLVLLAGGVLIWTLRS